MSETRRKSRRKNAKRRKKHPVRNFIVLLSVAAVIACTMYFTISNLGNARNMLEETAYPIKYSEQVEAAAQKYNLKREYIYAVMHTESRFNPNAESRVGAKGLMQLMPDTFDWLARMRGETVSPSSYTDPDLNIDYGCYFLRYLIDKFGSEETAAAAYNAGFNNVSKWLKDPNISPDGKTLTNIPFPETEKYVKKVEYAEKMYKKLYF